MEKESLRGLIFALAHKIKSDAEKNFRGRGLSIFQYFVLKHIAKGVTTQNDLARAIRVKPPSLVPIIDWLEKHRFVVRKPDSGDRRKINLLLTKRGEEVLRKIPHPSAPLFEKAVRKLGNTKRERLMKLLEELNGKV